MEAERITATIPATLKRAFTSHCRCRGLRPNRLLAAIILAYLRQDPHHKLRTITDYHDWQVETESRS